jgi:hypothetical protein
MSREDSSLHTFLVLDGIFSSRTIFHLASVQEALHASLQLLADPQSFGYNLPTSSYSPVTVYNYPLVSTWPPFPFLTTAPTQATAGQKSSTDPYVRSATSLSLTRTLDILKKYIGPHFDLEKLWEMHTYYVGRHTFHLSLILSAPFS